MEGREGRWGRLGRGGVSLCRGEGGEGRGGIGGRARTKLIALVRKYFSTSARDADATSSEGRDWSGSDRQPQDADGGGW